MAATVRRRVSLGSWGASWQNERSHGGGGGKPPLLTRAAVAAPGSRSQPDRLTECTCRNLWVDRYICTLPAESRVELELSSSSRATLLALSTAAGNEPHAALGGRARRLRRSTLDRGPGDADSLYVVEETGEDDIALRHIPSRTARIVDALAQAERIEQLIRDARDVELSDRPTASQLLNEAIAATRELHDLHELHAVGAFPTPAEFAEQLAGAGSAEELERIAADLRSAVAGE